MLKRFFISTKMNVPLYIVKKTLGNQCFSAFLVNIKGMNIYFVSLVEDMTQSIFQQKISSIISDMNMNIIEFDNSFDYRENYIYVDPSISDIEKLLDSFFIGGWSIEKGNYNLYYKVISSRYDDCLNLACFLKYIGVAFSSTLEEFPIVEIQNLPPNFNVNSFNQMNDQFLQIPVSYSAFIDNGQNCTGYILVRSIQSSNELINKLNMATISNYQIKAFHKFASPSSTSLNVTKISSPSILPIPLNHGIPNQASNNFFGLPLSNQSPQNSSFQQNPSSDYQNQPKTQTNAPKAQNKIKEVLIYPASRVKTVHVEQSLDVSIDKLRSMVEKFGKVDKLTIIETKHNSQVFEVVYNKTGSCDTILKSNQFKDCAKRANIHTSPVPTSPAIQYYPQEEEQSPALSLFDIRGNTVIIALEKDDDLKKFSEKMTNFGVYSRIVYQLFEDRKEVAVTFLHSGSSNTLLKCKEFQSSAVMAEDLFKYRSSLQHQQHQQQMQFQNQQQQQQIPIQGQPQPFIPQQQQNVQPPPFIFQQPPQNTFNFPPQQNFVPPQQQQMPFPPQSQQPNFNFQMRPQQQPQQNFNPPIQHQQFFNQQANFQYSNNESNPNNNRNNPNFFMGPPPHQNQQQPPYGQTLSMSSSQNSYNSNEL